MGENFYKVIAEKIRVKRKTLDMTQEQLAEKANLSVDTIKSVESGRRSMTLDTYFRIVQALETTPFYFINDKNWTGVTWKDLFT